MVCSILTVHWVTDMKQLKLVMKWRLAEQCLWLVFAGCELLVSFPFFISSYLSTMKQDINGMLSRYCISG